MGCHMQLISFLILGQIILVESYGGLLKGRSRLPRLSTSSTRRFVIEHLVDCTANPAIAEIYGDLAKDFCLQPVESTSTIFRGLGGFVEQAATIGFLVMSYFFFKRTANGISEWEEDDDDYDEAAQTDSTSGDKGPVASELRRCPQCNGRGKFEFDGNASTSPICDLCGGSGSLMRSVKSKTLGLPPSSRQLWSDRDVDDNDL
jgi:hypothetical protein